MGAYGIPGDPEGMRALARVLNAQAAMLGAVGKQVGDHVGAMLYQGPAASRCRATLGEWQSGRTSAASECEALADLLLAEARRVDAEQLEARLEQERREQAERERAARLNSRGGM